MADRGDVALWLLDFTLRLPINYANELSGLIRQLRDPAPDWNLQKLLLLRKIETEISTSSISEKVLEYLEQIEELEHGNKARVSEAMKKAYFAVAVDCVVRYLEKGEKEAYFEAVKRVWRSRVHQMGVSDEKVGLVSDELVDLGVDIESAVWDDGVCEKLLVKKKGIDAVEAVRVYVEEARSGVDACFLEVVAEKLEEGVHPVSELVGLGSKVMNMGKVQHKRKRPAGKSSYKYNTKTRRGVKIGDTDDLGEEPSPNKYGCLSKSEVSKLHEALRSSSSELQAIVKDPLPDALRMAKNIVAGMPSADKNADVGRTSNISSAEKNADVGQTDKSNIVNKRCSQQKNDPKPSLMERNSTACTFEWDESESADRVGGPHLPTPRRRLVSPLKRYDKPLRRKRKYWSNLEEDALREGVQKYGVGNWKVILRTYEDTFDERTEVDLKDKWRNMTSR